VRKSIRNKRTSEFRTIRQLLSWKDPGCSTVAYLGCYISPKEVVDIGDKAQIRPIFELSTSEGTGQYIPDQMVAGEFLRASDSQAGRQKKWNNVFSRQYWYNKPICFITVVPDKTYHLAAYLTDIRWHLTLV
jgi:hypothetical protein